MATAAGKTPVRAASISVRAAIPPADAATTTRRNGFPAIACGSPSCWSAMAHPRSCSELLSRFACERFAGACVKKHRANAEIAWNGIAYDIDKSRLVSKLRAAPLHRV